MADSQQLEGLPQGAVVGAPLQPADTQPKISGLPEGAVIGQPFKSSTSDASSTDTPKETPSTTSTVVDTLMNKSGPSGGPGMWTRAGQAVGLPTSKEEAEASQPSTLEALGGPAVQAVKMIYGTAAQGTKGRAEGGQEIKEAAQNIASGQPIMRNLGKAAYGAGHAILQSIPFLGAPTETMGEDIANKNYRGAVGGGIGILPMLLGGDEAKGAKAHNPVDVASLKLLQDRVAKAEKAHAPNQQLYDAHEADRQAGNPAPKDVLDPYEKTLKAKEDAQRALAAHQQAMAAKGTPAVPDQPMALSAEQQAAQDARGTPTKEENDAKLARLMEQAAPTEKPAPVAQNVKLPGQVQPETFPQEPTAAPRVDETTQMRTLGGNQGTIAGRPPRLLTEGVPEAPPAAPKAPAAPEAPKGEVLPPEKPTKPGRISALKAEGGKVVDTEPDIQQKIEEGLQGTAKPVAIPPKGEIAPKAEPVAEKPVEPAVAPDTTMKTLGAREAEALGKIKLMPAPPEFNERGQRLGVPTETPQDFGTKVRAEKPSMPRGERRARPRTEEENATTEMFRQARKELGEDATSDQIAARMEELKGAPKAEAAPKQEATGHSPEDVSKADQALTFLSDKELVEHLNGEGIDTKGRDWAKREGENRHRVERKEDVAKAVSGMSTEDMNDLVKASDSFDAKDTNIFDEASLNSANKATRSRAILKEFNRLREERVAPTTVGGEYGEANKVVTKEAKDAAVKSLTDKLTRSNAGLDPTTLADAAKIAAYHFEAGARAFADWSAKMVDDLGESIRPHLDTLWNMRKDRWAESMKAGEAPAEKEVAGSEKYGKVSDQLEKTLRELAPVKNDFAEPESTEATEFNPEKFQTGTGDVKVTPLSERPQKTILSIKVDGDKAGQVSLTPTPDLGEKTAEISTSQLGTAYRGKGHGTEAYKKVIDYARDKGMKTLYSDDQVSDKADNVWKSLVRSGDAKWDDSSKRYKVDISPLKKIRS